MEAVSTPGFGLVALIGLPTLVTGMLSSSWLPAGLMALGLTLTPAPLPPATFMPPAQLLRRF